MTATTPLLDRVLSFPARWHQERELRDLVTLMLRKIAFRQYRPIGALIRLGFAPDCIHEVAGSALLNPGRDTSIQWDGHTAPLVVEADGHLLIPTPLAALPPIVDPEHPTEAGHWSHNAEGRCWIPAHEYYDDASQVSATGADGKMFTPDPNYPYMKVKKADPQRMTSQLHKDELTPLVAQSIVKISLPDRDLQFFLCQPVIQLVIQSHLDGNRKSLMTIDTQADKSGRHMAFLYPELTGGLKAAIGFLVYGSWKTNTREENS